MKLEATARLKEVLAAEPSSLSKKRLQKVYSFSIQGNYEILTPKDGKSYPWRVSEKEKDVFMVAQAFREVMTDPIKWYKKKEGPKEVCYQYIIADWNKKVKIPGLGRTPI